MAKFNSSRTSKNVQTVQNLAGGPAYNLTDKMKVVITLLTSFVKDQYYKTAEDTLLDIGQLINGNTENAEFFAKASVYARKQFGMRSITHVTAAELVNVARGTKWIRSFLKSVINRPDDMLEILTYYFRKYGKEVTKKGNKKVFRAVPNSLKAAFASVLEGLNEYELSKYKKTSKELSLIDLVNLCHPKATDALTALMKGTLKPAETWETKLTQAGQKADVEEDKKELKAEAWAGLLKEKKLGYFALLRNLRNIAQQAPEMVNEACKQLVNEKAIKNSLVLPFRYTTALESLAAAHNVNPDVQRKIENSIENALDIAVNNVPKFDGSTCVILDCSGSMTGRPAQIGSLFAAVLSKSNNADIILFSDEAQYHKYSLSMSVSAIASSINFACGGTNFDAPIEKLNKKYDRLIILSDMQGWMGNNTPVEPFKKYCKKFDCKPFIYSLDLQGYGSTQFPEDRVFCIAGFSEKIFDVMKLLEQDRNALINEIEKIEL